MSKRCASLSAKKMGRVHHVAALVGQHLWAGKTYTWLRGKHKDRVGNSSSRGVPLQAHNRPPGTQCGGGSSRSAPGTRCRCQKRPPPPAAPASAAAGTRSHPADGDKHKYACMVQRVFDTAAVSSETSPSCDGQEQEAGC